ncbi:MAG TPA: zinc ABC transporter substrate-binding protein, partial [Solirubrobacterales bacterium]|nr:zinc ABC transporter substrate-binding protein [Solirubrobacterales bacterium]
DNPHQWYSPPSVQAVIAQITADYKRADPSHASYFEAARRSFEAKGLASYRRLISQIRSRYAGTPVGASESIFEPLAPVLGLKLITPPGFMDAVSEGAEPAPADRSAAERQIAGRRVAVWIYNPQNATPDVQRLNDAAEAAGTPIATVTETLTPEGSSFQAWMTRELKGLREALARGAGVG